jgi:DNA polymerase family A
VKYQHIVTLDFETYFSAEYSLKLTKYNTSEYIRDPQFKAHCVSIKIDNEDARIYYGDSIEDGIRDIDWSTSALLAHNTAFDGFILSNHFGVVPAYYLDTLSMARSVHSNSIRAGLDYVAKFYGVGNKLPDVLDKTKGVRDLPLDLLLPLGQYCAVDVELCYEIYKRMLPSFCEAELDLIDLTIRMFCDPVLLVDIPRAELALKKELDDRAALIAKTGVPEKDLRSANKFASHLIELGVQPPTKTSIRTGKLAFAFAKGDLDFQELLSNPDERVRDLVAARMAAKSTIEETRAIRFIQAGSFGRPLPVLLNYFGAHTSRWSAANKMNMQNLPRGGELRKAILAPPGMLIVSCDSAQIEARMLAWLADHDKLVELFRSGEDVYKHQAAAIYGIPVEEITSEQRFVGKVCTLGLGYGMGHEKFEYTLAAGLMGPAVKLPSHLCRSIVAKYRIVNLPIPRLWSKMGNALERMTTSIPSQYKCITFAKDEARLPNGVVLHYPNLTCDYQETEEFVQDNPNFRYYNLEEAVKKRMGFESKSKKIYGGLMTENLVQALARIVVANQMLEIAKKYRVVTMTHDEVVCVVPEQEVKEAEVFMRVVMSTPPEWCSDIPLNASVESGATYG